MEENPVEEYAPDFWLISPAEGGDPCGYITSPWYHPEHREILQWDMSHLMVLLVAMVFLLTGNVGKKYKVHLPDEYSDTPGVPVDAEIVSIPFTESYNANTREVSKASE